MPVGRDGFGAGTRTEADESTGRGCKRLLFHCHFQLQFVIVASAHPSGRIMRKCKMRRE